MALKAEVEAAGYHVAVGIAFTDSRHFLQQTIALAEQAMYKDKRAFYATGGKAGNARIADGKIDKLLMQKRDQEEFIQIIILCYSSYCEFIIKELRCLSVCLAHYFYIVFTIF